MNNKKKTLLDLPPNSSSLLGHLLRSYFVIYTNINLLENKLPLEYQKFGWINCEDGTLIPDKLLRQLPAVYTTICGCKKGCKEIVNVRENRSSAPNSANAMVLVKVKTLNYQFPSYICYCKCFINTFTIGLLFRISAINRQVFFCGHLNYCKSCPPHHSLSLIL